MPAQTYILTHSNIKDGGSINGSAGSLASNIAKAYGGKARSLLKLAVHGISVPPFVCVSSRAFKDCIGQHKAVMEDLLSKTNLECYEEVEKLSSAFQGFIYSSGIPTSLKQELEAQKSTLAPWKALSVRSSAENEDGSDNSFAGQLNSFLNVEYDDVEKRILDCWASVFSSHALIYSEKKQLCPLENSVAVIIQKLVDVQSAGVLFQADPIQGIQQQLIVAGYGYGEGIVTDQVETDLYTWLEAKKTWQISVACKTRKLDVADRGLIVSEVPEHLRNQAVLNEDQREALLLQSRRISKIYSHWQDIEWCVDHEGAIYILQSRPITTIPQGEYRLFDGSNIAESYPGVVLPTTFSVLSRDYYHCVRGVLELFGVPKVLIKKNDYELRHLVGYIQGRSYYNINHWYKILLLSPFFKSKIVQYFEEMIGTENRYEGSVEPNQISLFQRIHLAIRAPAKIFWHLLRQDRLISDYFSESTKLQGEFQALDPKSTSSDDLIAFLNRYVSQFTELLRIPIANDFYTMIFMALTRDLLKRTGVEDAEGVLNGALINQKIESSKPVESMQKLAGSIRDNIDLHNCLEQLVEHAKNNHLNDVLKILKAQHFSEFSDQLNTHMNLYGHRSPKELIMEAYTFREKPFFLIQILLSMAQGPDNRSETQPKSLDETFQNLGHFRFKRLFYWCLNKTRRSIAHRESTRLDRGLHFSNFRQLLIRIGKQLTSEHLIDHERHVFYLKLEELDAIRNGCSVDNDIRSLVAHRQQQALQWQEKKLPERIFTQGSVYANPIPEYTTHAVGECGSLQGHGCSEGVITGEAVIVKDPTQAGDIRGKILIAESTDPGWVYLMTLSAGLIAERGSTLSHTAIIGRELGIPTIVGVENATGIFKTGQHLKMNGKTGEIQILDEVSLTTAPEEKNTF